jgi:hypothetical protein
MFTTILTAFILAQCAAVGWMGWRGYQAYRDTEGSTWERVKAGFKRSATVGWDWMNAASVAMVAMVTYTSDLLGFPGVKDALTPFLTPKLMVAYVLTLSLGSILARFRTL